MPFNRHLRALHHSRVGHRCALQVCRVCDGQGDPDGGAASFDPHCILSTVDKVPVGMGGYIDINAQSVSPSAPVDGIDRRPQIAAAPTASQSSVQVAIHYSEIAIPLFSR